MAGSVISLKSSVFFSRFEDGVVFRGSEAPVVFRGKRAYDLVRALLDRMAGGVTREQLLGGLPDPVRIAADRLIDELQRNALLRERDPDDLAPEADLAGRFGNLWSYLADHHARPGKALAAWRDTHFVIHGDAEAAPYAARALAECAAERVSLIGPAAANGAVLDQIRADFPGLELHADRPAHGPAIAIHAGGGRPFAAAGVTERDCWYFGLLAGHLAAGFIDGPVATVVPAWEARMRPPLDGWEQGRISGQRIALAAAAMAFGAFNRHAGIGGNGGPDPYLVEPSSQISPLQLQRAVTLGGPAAEPISDPDDQAFEAAILPLFDSVTGIFIDVTDNLTQVPLLTCALRVYGHDRSDLGVALGWGMSLGEARRRAVARGIVAHLRSVPALAAASIAAARSPGEALAASRAAVLAAGATLAPLALTALTQPEGAKLAKLFGLVTGTAPTLTGWSTEGAACVAVHHDGRIVARGCAGTLEAAAYQALGDACLAIQLPDTNGLVAESWASPAANPAGPATLADAGFATLAGHVYAAVAGGPAA